MGIFSEQKPYTAVTNWVDQLTSEQYEEDDYTGVPDLCEVARLQDTGPTEAARAIRKKLKYGNIHRQARALTLLDAILMNGDRRVRCCASPRRGLMIVAIATDEPLLERLKVLVTDSMTDHHVKQKAVELFGSWAVNFRDIRGMERLTSLRGSVPTKKRVVHVRPPTPDNEPSSPTSPRRNSASSPPSSSAPSRPPRPTQQQSPPRQMHKKNRSKDTTKEKTNYKPINFDKERPAILQNIAAATQSSTNLTNALKHLNRETQHPEDDPQIQQLYRQCRTLRKNILIYIQRTESEDWVGTLINANDELIQALAQYEKAIKPIEQDSDSDAWSVSDSEDQGRHAPKQQREMSTGGFGRNVAEDLAQRLRQTSLSRQQRDSPPPKPPRPTVESPPPKPPRPTVDTTSPPRPQRPIPPMLPVPNMKGKQPVEEEEDDDPFGDSHQVHTPTLAGDKKGWLEL